MPGKAPRAQVTCEGDACEAETAALLQLQKGLEKWHFGGIVPGDSDYQRLEGAAMPEIPLFGGKLPVEFDAREAWPHCKHVVNHIRDQSNCGSCWAVGSVSTFNDRLCILKGDTKTILSADDPLANCNSTIEGSSLPTCVKPVQGGCFGGQLEFVWKWYVEAGAVSGAGFVKADKHPGSTCAPYPFPPCNSPAYAGQPECQTNFKTPAPFSQCDHPFKTPYLHNKVKATSWYKVPRKKIQEEIMARGPVSCQVLATCSMKDYTGGVYVPSGRVCGGHVMRIVGWGVEAGKDYWWVANSWGPHWGLGGFIKWIRGFDAQGIESGVVAGIC